MQRPHLQFLNLPHFHAAWFALLGPASLFAISTGIALGFRVGPGRLR